MLQRRRRKRGERRKTGEKEKEEKQQHYYFLEGKFKNVISNNEIFNGLRNEKKILGVGNSSSSVFKMDNLSHSRK